MPIIRSILTWLGLDRPNGKVGFRPHRTIELPLELEPAYEKCLEGLDRVLGATVYRSELNAAKGNAYIEAGFGLVNSERLRVSLNVAATKTQIRIEAIYPANITAPEKSLSVETLADFLWC